MNCIILLIVWGEDTALVSIFTGYLVSKNRELYFQNVKILVGGASSPRL